MELLDAGTHGLRGLSCRSVAVNLSIARPRAVARISSGDGEIRPAPLALPLGSGTQGGARRCAVMVKVLPSDAAEAAPHQSGPDDRIVPLIGLGWRCDFCGEITAGRERPPAPSSCPRCHGSLFTSMEVWREH